MRLEEKGTAKQLHPHRPAARRRLEWALTILAALGLVAGLSVTGRQKPAPASGATAGAGQVIEITAVKFDFSPAVVRVKRGPRVTLRVTATDRRHGIEIHPYAEGADKKGPPGLRFPGARTEWNLGKDATQVIEFVAERPGRYKIECSVFCGLRHNEMEGWIIVE